MTGKRSNALREFHLMIVRESDGFTGQVRYNRHARPVERGLEIYPTHAAALAHGEVALARHRDVPRDEP